MSIALQTGLAAKGIVVSTLSFLDWGSDIDENSDSLIEKN